MISLVEAYNQLLNEAFASSDAVIRRTIRERKLAAFYYMGDEENAPGWRTVECVAFGQGMAKFPTTRNKKYIRAWQRKGKTLSVTPGWKFFRTDRIRNWSIGTQTFDTPRPLFNPNGDKTMWRVIEIARFPNQPGTGGGAAGGGNTPTTPPRPTGPTQKTPTAPKRPVAPKQPRIVKTVKPTAKPTQPTPQPKPQPKPQPQAKPQPKPTPVKAQPTTKPQTKEKDPAYF